MSTIYVHGGSSDYYYEEPKIKLTYTAKATRSGTTVTVELSNLKLERADEDSWFGYNIWVYVSPNDTKNSSKDKLLIERDVGTPDGDNAYWSAITKSDTVTLTISDVPASQDSLAVYFKTASPCSSNCNGGNAAHQGTSDDIGVTSGRYVGDRLPVGNHTFTGLKSEVTITWNANGGSSVSSTKKTPGASIGTLPTTSRTGYQFKGWYTAASGGTKITTTTTVPNSNTTYYAQWEKNTLTIYFHANGGSIKEEKLSEYTINSYGYIHDVEKGSRYIQEWTYNDAKTNGLPNPSTFGLARTGYTFSGWGTSESGGTVFDPDDTGLLPSEINSEISNDDVTDYLYAQWAVKSFTVTFDANGGSCTTQSKEVTFGATYGTLPTPTRQWYRFDGWFTDATGGTQKVASSIYDLSSDSILYAHWTRLTYTVTFNANGGDAEDLPEDITAYQGVEIKIPSMFPDKSGYTFGGWGDKSSSPTKIYKPGDKYDKYDANATLYAVWTAKSFTVTFDLKGGTTTGGTLVQTVPYGGSATPPPNPTKKNKTFKGWLGNYKKVTSNRTITAMWDSSPIWIMTNSGWKPYHPSGE